MLIGVLGFARHTSHSHPVNYVYHKILLNENKFYLVFWLVNSLVTINNVY